MWTREGDIREDFEGRASSGVRRKVTYSCSNAALQGFSLYVYNEGLVQLSITCRDRLTASSLNTLGERWQSQVNDILEYVVDVNVTSLSRSEFESLITVIGNVTVANAILADILQQFEYAKLLIGQRSINEVVPFRSRELMHAMVDAGLVRGNFAMIRPYHDIHFYLRSDYFYLSSAYGVIPRAPQPRSHVQTTVLDYDGVIPVDSIYSSPHLLFSIAIASIGSIGSIASSARETHDNLHAALTPSIHDYHSPTPAPLPDCGANVRKLADIKYQEGVPDEYCCALSQEIMTDPVYDPKNPQYKFERTWIEQSLKEKKENPFTRTPLRKSELKPDDALKKQIEKFVEEKVTAFNGSARRPK